MSDATGRPSAPTCGGPDPDPRTPATPLPQLSCDTHCHVFGPHDRFPFAPERTFTPPEAPRAQLAAVHSILGFERAVIVQSACHGFDLSAMLDALRADPSHYRGVALLRPGSSRKDLALLHDAGVRGVRFNFVRHTGGPPPLEEMRATITDVARFGWTVSLHLENRDVIDHFDFIRQQEVPVIIDHLGRIDLNVPDGEGAAALHRLLELDHVWVKLSGFERISTGDYPFDDAIAVAKLLAAHAPRRVIWGTDYPHPNLSRTAPNDGALVDLVDRIVPDPKLRDLLLRDNPAQLFDF